MSESGDETETTIANDLVVTKYKVAAEIANKALKAVIDSCIVDASVLSLADIGDNLILEETKNIFKKDKEMRRGVAFPTCISINNCIGHYSPVKSDPEIKLAEGDVVKIDLGAHIDGYIAVVGHTLVVGANAEKPCTGPKADAIHAAYQAAAVALRLVVPGGENEAVTDAIQKVAESYKCKPISGMLSHQLKQFKIDGEKSIIENPTEAQKKSHEKCEFEVNEVYAIDILVSTGEGKGREIDAKTTVYKKTDEVYQLKMKASRTVLSDVDNKFGVMPFSLRFFENEVQAKMGLKECVNHKLIEPFPILHEKEGEFVAQFKFTVLLMPTRSHKITGLPLDLTAYKTDLKIEDESIVKLLNSSNPDSKKKKNKKAKKAVEEITSQVGQIDVGKESPKTAAKTGLVSNKKQQESVKTAPSKNKTWC